MIDVSQSVEHDHPMALDFLRRDCVVMNNFFRNGKAFVMTTLKLFNFITDINIEENQVEKTLNDLLQEAQQGYSDELIQQDKVFEQVYIPRSLQELSHVDLDREKKFGTETFYEKLTGLNIEDENVAAEEQEYDNKKVFKDLLDTATTDD
jgi:RIO kinase 1